MEMRQGIGQAGGSGCILAGGRAALAGTKVEKPDRSAGGAGMKGAGPQDHCLLSLAGIEMDLLWGLGHGLFDHLCRDVHAAVLAQHPTTCSLKKGQYGRLMDDDARPVQYLERPLVDLLNVSLGEE
jgi:hypothetical protein